MPTATQSDGGLDGQLSSWIYQSAGEVEAWQLRKDHQAAMDMTPRSCLANDNTKKQLCQLLQYKVVKDATSRLDKTDMAVFIVKGRTQFVTKYGDARFVMLLVLVLRCLFP